MPVVDVWVMGIDTAMAGLVVETERITAKATAKMMTVAKLVQGTARINMSQHNDSGDTLRAIKVSQPKIISKFLQGETLSAFSEQQAAPPTIRFRGRDPATGRFTKLTGSAVIPKIITITVGIDQADKPAFFVGSTFEHGWQSDAGKQPPVKPLAEWAMRRGIADSKSARSVGFMIAKTIGQKGYSFGEHHWLSDAWELHKTSAQALTSGFLR